MQKQKISNHRQKHIRCSSFLLEFALKSQSPLFLKSLNSQEQPQSSTKIPKLLEVGSCLRCKQKASQVTCNLCKKDFCIQCDNFIHKMGKFKFHIRNPLNIGNKDANQAPQQQNNQFVINISGPKSSKQPSSIQKNIHQINITQKWSKIISELEDKFEECILLMMEKRDDLINKLDKKRNQQLKMFSQESGLLKNGSRLNESPQTKRSQMSERLQTPISKMKISGCEHSDQNRKCLGKYQICNTIFQEFKLSIQKFDIKSTLTKIVCTNEQEPKKKGRGSMLLNLTSLVPSPYTSSSTLRSPKAKLSKSIWMQQKQIKTAPKHNQQQQQGLKLHKIKSQKLIMKTKNMDLSLISPRKDNKLKKLELMI